MGENNARGVNGHNLKYFLLTLNISTKIHFQRVPQAQRPHKYVPSFVRGKMRHYRPIGRNCNFCLTVTPVTQLHSHCAHLMSYSG